MLVQIFGLTPPRICERCAKQTTGLFVEVYPFALVLNALDQPLPTLERPSELRPSLRINLRAERNSTFH